MRIRIASNKKTAVFGRFGGGWNWALGFKAGGPSLIIFLLVFAVRIDR